MPAVSPLAPASFPDLAPIAGVSLAVASCGIRYANRTDLLVAQFAEGTHVAGVFTRSLTASAPVLAGREALKSTLARTLVVNSGNSNAFTGARGVASVEAVAKAFGGKQGFFMSSTGVIGEPLPHEKIIAALPTLSYHASFMDAAKAIMTTDTFPKLATRTAQIAGTRVNLNGIAKGSGMIAPDMATMLAYVFTDAAIPAPELQALLEAANAKSFNAITVDGDTSTSDTLLAFATGAAKNAAGDLADFSRALHELLHELALYVVDDGEGAQKRITITVHEAEHVTAARIIGMNIANSPLVKTAIAASDANWGRIVAAVGKAGQRAERDRLWIKIGGVSVAREGMIDPSYREEALKPHMHGRDIRIEVGVGVGDASFTAYSCDLTHGYVDINGSYRS